MTRPAIEVADIVRRDGRQFLQRFKAVLNYQQLKAYRAVKRCRTAALGGHRKCENCAYEAPFSYNSCRSGCCPKCQAQARRRWLQIQQRDLLNTNYFPVVFTLLALTSRRPLLDLLFDASSQTLLEVAAEPRRLGAEIGFLSILHSWDRTCCPITISMPWFPAADCRPTASAGFIPAIPCSCCRFRFCVPSSVRSSSQDSATSTARTCLTSEVLPLRSAILPRSNN